MQNNSENNRGRSDYRFLPDSNEKLKEAVNKQRIINHSKIAVQTSFVYALEVIENTFGKLWGEDKADGEELTDSEIYWEDKFLQARKQIMDNGHKNIRKLEEILRKL